MLSCDSCCADDAVAYRSVDDSGGFQGLGGVFPDAPSIRCFPQVIQSGWVSPLLEPVIRHIVDCRADLDAKSRPAGNKSRRSKGSGVSPECRAPARRLKCFKSDIRVVAFPGAGAGGAALHKGLKKFSRDFPESAQSLSRRAFHSVPDRPKTRNVSSEKHQLRRRGFLRRKKPVSSDIAVLAISRESGGGLHHTIFSPTMHSPDSAIESDSIRIHDSKKMAAADQAAFTTDGASCTQQIVECTFAPNAVRNG